MRPALLAMALLAAGGCALDASVRVVTTAREHCEWRETVALQGRGDRFRFPVEAVDAVVVVDDTERLPAAPGGLVEIVYDEARQSAEVRLDGTAVASAAGGARRVSVEWTRREVSTARAEEVVPVDAAALPWAIDWEVRPVPRRVPGGECRLDDVATTVELVGPDADALELEVETTEGRVRGTVRRKP